MSAPTSTPRKRRREDDGSGRTSSGRIRVLDRQEGGPIIISSTSTELPRDRPLELYRHKSHADRSLVRMDGQRVEWESQNHRETKDSSDTRYLIGVFRKSTQELVILPVDEHQMQATVKAVKLADTVTSEQRSAQTAAERMADRIKLGEAFGTSKQKRKLRNDQRNQAAMDTKSEGLVALQSLLQDGIDTATASLPTKEKVKADADEARPVPPYVLSADSPSEIYPLEGVVPNAELSQCNPQPLVSAKSPAKRLELLPYKESTFVNDLLELQIRQLDGKDDAPLRGRIRTLIALSAMIAFYKRKGHAKKRTEDMPKAVARGLIARFTEKSLAAEIGGGDGKASSSQITPTSTTKLLSYIAVLALHIDQFQVDVGIIAADLGLTVQKTSNIFRSVGCKILSMPANEKVSRQKLGRKISEGTTAKIARLSAPLVFPDASVGKKR